MNDLTYESYTLLLWKSYRINRINKNHFDYIYQNFGRWGLNKEQFRLGQNPTIKHNKTFFENGNLKTEEWIVELILTDLTITYNHRLKEPSYIEYYNSGNVKKKIYTFNGCLINTNDASIIEWYDYGVIKKKSWYHFNKNILSSELHKTDGPAVIEWYENGQKKEYRYYKNNHLYRDTKGPKELIWDELGNYIEI